MEKLFQEINNILWYIPMSDDKRGSIPYITHELMGIYSISYSPYIFTLIILRSPKEIRHTDNWLSHFAHISSLFIHSEVIFWHKNFLKNELIIKKNSTIIQGNLFLSFSLFLRPECFCNRNKEIKFYMSHIFLNEIISGFFCQKLLYSCSYFFIIYIS